MRALTVALAVIASLSGARASAGPPEGAEELVAVASSDAEFLTALSAALAPAGLRVIATVDPPPLLGALSLTARQIAERERATSTVWLISEAGKTTLITYDRDVDRALVREAPYPAPLRTAQAAEIARMARTMLRALRLTPEVDLPVPRVAEARAARAELATAQRHATAQPRATAPERRRVAVTAAVGLRAGAAAGASGPVGSLGLAWRPGALGLELGVAVASRGDLVTPSFAGRVADDSLSLVVRAPVWRASRLRLIGAAGGAVHGVRVSGQLGPEEVSALRLDPGLRVGIIASYAIGRNLAVGLSISTDALLTRQRFLVSGEEILIVPRVQASAGVLLTLAAL